MADTHSVLYPDTVERLEAFFANKEAVLGVTLPEDFKQHVLVFQGYKTYEEYIAAQERVFDEFDVWSRITPPVQRVIACLNHLATCYFMTEEDFRGM
jgi:hypothetical protein